MTRSTAAPRRHAARHERGLPDGNHHHAEHHLHPVRLLRHRVASTPMGRDWPKDQDSSFLGYSIGWTL